MVLGITGNIASGKSSVAREFASLGAAVVDADQLARDAVAPGSAALERLVGSFGEQILTAAGTLDRERLGEMIFADDEARQRLNAIVHPAIAELAEARLNELSQRQDVPLVVYEAALLFEAGAEKRVDRVLVVKIDPQVQLQRLLQRDQLSQESAQQRMAAQMSQAEKINRADFVIDNSGTPQEMKRQVASLWTKLTS